MNADSNNADVPFDEDLRHAAARSYLNDAERDLSDEVETELPQRPLETGIISFLFDADAAIRWLVLTVTGYVVQILLIYTIQFWSSKGFAQIAAVLIWVALTFVGIGFIVLASACCVAIVTDTANGLKKVKNWPDLNFTEWALDSFYVINSLFLSFMPGCLAGQLIVFMGAPMWFSFITGGLSVFFLFPPTILASIEHGSSIWPAEQHVWYSLRSHPKTWKRFYLLSVILAVAGFAAHMLIWTEWVILSSLAAAGTVTITMIYFRLLGRISRVIDEVADERDDEADRANASEVS